MTIETEVAALTTATTSLLTAVNVSKATLDTKVADATTQAGTAATQSGIAITQATNAATSAALALTRAETATTQASAATAAAVGASNIVLGVSTLYPAIRPSLDLDFANGQTVDPRITFTRASTATRTNSRGLIEAVASGVPRLDFDPVTGACKGLLIEEQRANLLTFSEMFSESVWVFGAPLQIRVANGVVAPDGSMTAYVLSTTNAGSVYQNAAASGVGTYTASIFIHTSSTCTNCSISGFFLGSSAEGFGGLTVNPATGALISSTVSSYSITNVGNGWYRYSITKTGTIAGNTIARFQIYSQIVSANTLVVWGAQLEAGAFPTTYQPSTETFTGRASTATFYGSNGLIQTASSGVARMGYNPMNLTVAPKLLLEASSANLLTYSEVFDNAGWVKVGGAAAASNTTLAPDGTTTADTLTVSSSKQVFQSAILQPAGTYCFSCFVKSTGASQVYIQLNVSGGAASGIDINFTAKTVSVRFGSPVAFGVIDCGNGWLRPWVVLTSNATASVSGYIVSASASDETVFAWGAQLEASPYATSYIPTVASQVTRIADTSTSAQTTRAADVASMTGVNFSSWYRSDEGSFVVGFDAPSIPSDTATYNRVYSVNSGANANSLEAYFNGGWNPDRAAIAVVVGGVSSFDSSNTANGWVATPVAYAVNAMAYKIDSFATSWNGLVVSTDSLGPVPLTVNQINIGCYLTGNQINGHIRSLSYYPKRLTNAELGVLSTQ